MLICYIYVYLLLRLLSIVEKGNSMKKILIANRGEIALRVMRAAKEMGISTVAVFSDADRTALHVRYADEAVHIGASPSDQSYLAGKKIIEAALQSKADAIHPGYGFLSENPDFAALVEKNNLIFIGPSAKSMRTMGNKLSAKAAALKYNVPMVPGTDKAIGSADEGKNIAKSTGYPVLIKAAAGGGGKGMRVVQRESDFEEQMKLAANEAKSAFGDGSIFIEKYIISPRHIEVQILGDKSGNVIHLFERECSIQRRHQKIVEEAPSSVLTLELRKKIGDCAVKVAKSCNYYGAGTVEFLTDEKNNFYFLEMNTRLQVEHPVTELITGIDLVKEQINIAKGNKLNFKQEDVSINGHAIELRVCAEDPSNKFLPDIGTLTTYRIPKGPGIRVDDGYEENMEIPIYYDPLIAKLISHGKTRAESIQRMKRAIDEYKITGIATTLPFGKFVMNHKAFISGQFDTHFIEKYFNPDDLDNSDEEEMQIAALVGAKLMTDYFSDNKSSIPRKISNPVWKKNRKVMR